MRFDRALADALFIGDQNVAGGGADDFHQRVRLRAGNGAHVAVEGAAGDGHTLRQTVRWAHSALSVPTGTSAVRYR